MSLSLLHIFVLRTAAGLVPRPQRSEWLREWIAELTYLQRNHTRQSATAFCFGAFHDALIVRSQSGSLGTGRDIVRGTSAASCLAVLAVQAIIAAMIMWACPAVRASVWKNPVQSHAVIAAATMLLHLIAPGTHRFQIDGTRSWCFMTAKLALLTLIVYFGSFDIVPLISRAPVQPQIAFVMYLMAYRWAINDQRRRCPVCLRFLTHPVPVGHTANTLLEWYGTELMCSRGHGVLHEPEPLASSYCARRWVRLDPSWQALFR